LCKNSHKKGKQSFPVLAKPWPLANEINFLGGPIFDITICGKKAD
jgi:hypothetical protein